jgi:hypothetical protein
MKRTTLMTALMILLQGCVDMRVAMVTERDAKGREIEQLIAELKSKGLACSDEFRERLTTGAPSRYLTIACAIKETALMCPESYTIYVDFDPVTRKVCSLNKFARTNCF